MFVCVDFFLYQTVKSTQIISSDCNLLSFTMKIPCQYGIIDHNFHCLVLGFRCFIILIKIVSRDINRSVVKLVESLVYHVIMNVHNIDGNY